MPSGSSRGRHATTLLRQLNQQLFRYEHHLRTCRSCRQSQSRQQSCTHCRHPLGAHVGVDRNGTSVTLTLTTYRSSLKLQAKGSSVPLIPCVWTCGSCPRSRSMWYMRHTLLFVFFCALYVCRRWLFESAAKGLRHSITCCSTFKASSFPLAAHLPSVSDPWCLCCRSPLAPSIRCARASGKGERASASLRGTSRPST